MKWIPSLSPQAGIGGPRTPGQLLIALEPEAASIYCRKLKVNQLVSDRPKSALAKSLAKDPDSHSVSSDYVLEDSGTGELIRDHLQKYQKVQFVSLSNGTSRSVHSVFQWQ